MTEPVETIRDRVQGLRRIRAGDLIANPKNWRRHPEPQRAAIRASLREIGWAGVATGFEHPDQPGKIMLIDGHLRGEPDPDPDMEVPIVILDVTPAEADKLLATFDPIGGMADCDTDALGSLARTIDFQAPELRAVVLGVVGDMNVPQFSPASQAEQGRLDQKSPIKCPHCGQEFVPP